LGVSNQPQVLKKLKLEIFFENDDEVEKKLSPSYTYNLFRSVKHLDKLEFTTINHEDHIFFLDAWKHLRNFNNLK